jgi:hypothetical protein
MHPRSERPIRRARDLSFSLFLSLSLSLFYFFSSYSITRYRVRYSRSIETSLASSRRAFHGGDFNVRAANSTISDESVNR